MVACWFCLDGRSKMKDGDLTQLMKMRFLCISINYGGRQAIEATDQ